MYARCGSLAKAQEVLKDLSLRNVVSWNALISGFAQQGKGGEALDGFKQMQCEGILPNSVTFLCVLNACSHSGLVNEGQMYFTIMSEKYGIIPNSKHQACMVDLFCRTGDFKEAVAMIKKMPLCDYTPIWSGLIDACKKSGNVNLAKLAFGQVVELDCEHRDEARGRLGIDWKQMPWELMHDWKGGRSIARSGQPLS
jgi:pentatricopeptide repeat protein